MGGSAGCYLKRPEWWGRGLAQVWRKGPQTDNYKGPGDNKRLQEARQSQCGKDPG